MKPQINPRILSYRLSQAFRFRIHQFTCLSNGQVTFKRFWPAPWSPNLSHSQSAPRKPSCFFGRRHPRGFPLTQIDDVTAPSTAQISRSPYSRCVSLCTCFVSGALKTALCEGCLYVGWGIYTLRLSQDPPYPSVEQDAWFRLIQFVRSVFACRDNGAPLPPLLAESPQRTSMPFRFGLLSLLTNLYDSYALCRR